MNGLLRLGDLSLLYSSGFDKLYANMEPTYPRMRPKEEIYLQHFGVKSSDEVDKIFPKGMAEGSALPWSSYTKMTLPYEAPSHPAIPTMSDIEQAMKRNRINHRFGNFPVCRIGEVVVKMGWEEAILHVRGSSIWTVVTLKRIAYKRESRKLKTSYFSRNIPRFVYQSYTPSLPKPTTLPDDLRTIW